MDQRDRDRLVVLKKAQRKLMLRGYRFAVSAGGGGYTVNANPLTFNVTGRRCFYSDQSMTIHENKGPEPATAESPVFKR